MARRLTKAWMGSSTPASPSGNTYVQTIVYNMDDDGNRTSVVTTPYGVSPTTQSYTSNSLNQYTAVGAAGQTYDANGNLTNNSTFKFKYNYKNLICEVRQAIGNALVATYTYDANGRRIGKVVSGGITQRFIYADVETIETFDGSNNWKQDFVFDVTGIDGVLMLEQADVLDYDSDSNTTEVVRSYYHRNALGSVLEVTDASQAEAASYRYTPYGQASITKGGVSQGSDPLGQAYMFRTRAYDPESGLANYRFGGYDAQIGRGWRPAQTTWGIRLVSKTLLNLLPGDPGVGGSVENRHYYDRSPKEQGGVSFACVSSCHGYGRRDVSAMDIDGKGCDNFKARFQALLLSLNRGAEDDAMADADSFCEFINGTSRCKCRYSSSPLAPVPNSPPKKGGKKKDAPVDPIPWVSAICVPGRVPGANGIPNVLLDVDAEINGDCK